jgi:hypothetical protein
MKLLTKVLRAKLEANGANPDKDYAPVVKFFGGGACTWLLSELDGDIAFGLCDLGFGCPELGYVSLSELASLKFPPFGLPVERDLHFKGDKPLSEYANEARAAGRIAA